MNKIYKLIWSAQVQAYIVTSELAHKGGKTATVKLLSILGITLAAPTIAHAQCLITSPDHKACTISQQSLSHNTAFADTTITNNLIENRDPASQTINTSNDELNQTLTIRNQTGAGDLTVNANNKNITNIDARNDSTGAAFTLTTTQDMSGSDVRGIYIEHNGTDVHLSTASIHSRQLKGISINNRGTGATIINSGNTITSDNDDAIYAVNDPTATDVQITAGAVTGHGKGIYVANNGTGSTTITVSQGVVSETTDGIYAHNSATAKNLTTYTNSTVHGYSNGIYAENNGNGITSITTIGDVESQNGDGVHINHNGQKLTLNSKNVQGTSNGIYAINSGNDSTEITSSATVKSTSGNGIFVNNGSNTRDLTISTNVVSGSDNGIYASNNGSGSTVIKNSATITATDNTGIRIENNNQTTGLRIESQLIHAGNNGIYAINNGSNATDIISQGEVTATKGYGIWAENGNKTTDINIIQSGGKITGGISGIEARNSGTGNTLITLANQITGGSGAGIISHDKAGSTTTITLNTGSRVSATSGLAISDEEGNAIVTLKSGSTVSGRIELGNGSDILNVNRGTNISEITVMDGGDDTSSNDGMIDTLNINQTLTGSTTGTNNGVAGNIAIRNWEKINLAQNSTLNLSGDLNTNQLNIGDGTTIRLIPDLKQARIEGDVLNSGYINLNSTYTGDNLTIGGNYQGNNGKLILDLKLNSAQRDSNTPDNTADKLIIQGNASGNTTIRFDKVEGLGGDTGNTNGIEVVEVKGNSTQDAFALNGNRLSAGAYEYHLFKGDLQQNGNNWYLRSQKQTNPPDGGGTGGGGTGGGGTDGGGTGGGGTGDGGTGGGGTGGGGTGDGGTGGGGTGGGGTGGGGTGGGGTGGGGTGGGGTGGGDTGGGDTGGGTGNGTTVKPSKLKPLYRKEVPLLATVATQLRQADNLMLANMHQRIGATPIPEERMSWGRVLANRTDIQQNGPAEGRSTGNYAGLQLGSDVWTGNGWRIGGYIGYLHGNLDIDGFASGVDDKVGKNTTKSYFIGAYSNYTRTDGAYADFVLQAARHRADIKPDYNPISKQKGHGITASIEIGKPFTLANSNWKIEPQAQIIHQWLDLNDSNISGHTSVSQEHNNAWLFRLGGRLAATYQLNKGLIHPYARVNFYYSPDGSDKTSYRTISTTTTLNAGASHRSTELALGGTYDINNTVKIYGEIGHTWSNGGNAKVKVPVNASAGLKIDW
ncbi:autotransporter outer membrane beta-barrel domain-containing protein [Snodgrassella alvi]|uniref:autotransporter outer membrane beta-barrel domain-containing protein n=1 Tax=Snodgrassella alvi TaxID=1196083 RepID=UPI003511F6CA